MAVLNDTDRAAFVRRNGFAHHDDFPGDSPTQRFLAGLDWSKRQSFKSPIGLPPGVEDWDFEDTVEIPHGTIHQALGRTREREFSGDDPTADTSVVNPWGYGSCRIRTSVKAYDSVKDAAGKEIARNYHPTFRMEGDPRGGKYAQWSQWSWTGIQWDGKNQNSDWMESDSYPGGVLTMSEWTNGGFKNYRRPHDIVHEGCEFGALHYQSFKYGPRWVGGSDTTFGEAGKIFVDSLTVVPGTPMVEMVLAHAVTIRDFFITPTKASCALRLVDCDGAVSDNIFDSAAQIAMDRVCYGALVQQVGGSVVYSTNRYSGGMANPALAADGASRHRALLTVLDGGQAAFGPETFVGPLTRKNPTGTSDGTLDVWADDRSYAVGFGLGRDGAPLKTGGRVFNLAALLPQPSTTPSVRTPLDFACTYCDAPVGTACVTSTGHFTSFHTARVKAAAA